jgi:phage shock protein A
VKATYTAAEAQTRVGEAFSGISEEMGDVGMAIQRAEDKTAELQARSGAIDELLASGALDDVSGTASDNLSIELDRLSAGGDVDLELARMKQEITAGPSGEAPKQIEGQTANGEPVAEQAPKREDEAQ